MRIHITDEEFGTVLGKRWQTMFASVHAGEQLGEQIHVAMQTEAVRKRRRFRVVRFDWQFFSGNRELVERNAPTIRLPR